MKINFVNHLTCPNHSDRNIKLSIKSLICQSENECTEGFLECKECEATFPIIDGVAIIVNDIVGYIETRTEIYGRWILNCKSNDLKEYLKNIGKKISNPTNLDRYEEGGILFPTYKWMQNANHTEDRLMKLLRWKIKPNEIHYKIIHGLNTKLDGIVLDIGCATGTTTLQLTNKFSFVIGVDLSFSFIKEARKNMYESNISNVEFFVMDIAYVPFSQLKFDLIIALNVIELVNTQLFLKMAHKILKPHAEMIIASPYDFNREKTTDKIYDEKSLRDLLRSSGFEISVKTGSETFTPWILKISERTYLFYFVDFIKVKKISKHKSKEMPLKEYDRRF